MILNDSIDPKGHLTVQMRNRAGEVVAQTASHNDIVLTGRDLVAKMFIGQSIGSVSHVAVGTDSTPTDPGITSALGSELFRKGINTINPALHLATTPDGKKKVTISCDLDFNEANGALTEAALFNQSSNGVMYNRVVFPPVNKTSDFKLTLIWEITF
ncbi:MAG: hypothetical protein AAGN35_01520 [Bacteroidota bacterium]